MGNSESVVRNVDKRSSRREHKPMFQSAIVNYRMLTFAETGQQLEMEREQEAVAGEGGDDGVVDDDDPPPPPPPPDDDDDYDVDPPPPPPLSELSYGSDPPPPPPLSELSYGSDPPPPWDPDLFSDDEDDAARALLVAMAPEDRRVFRNKKVEDYYRKQGWWRSEMIREQQNARLAAGDLKGRTALEERLELHRNNTTVRKGADDGGGMLAAGKVPSLEVTFKRPGPLGLIFIEQAHRTLRTTTPPLPANAARAADGGFQRKEQCLPLRYIVVRRIVRNSEAAEWAAPGGGPGGTGGQLSPQSYTQQNQTCTTDIYLHFLFAHYG